MACGFSCLAAGLFLCSQQSMLPFASAGSNDPREFHACGHNPKTQNEPYLCHTKSSTESVFQLAYVSTGVAGHELKHNTKRGNDEPSADCPHRDFAIDYDLKNFIDDTIKTAIEEAVQSSVDKELLLMVRGEGFKKRLNALIDARLHVLAEEIAVKTNGAGPGRGHTGRTHKKISLSLPARII